MAITQIYELSKVLGWQFSSYIILGCSMVILVLATISKSLMLLISIKRRYRRLLNKPRKKDNKKEIIWTPYHK